MKFYNISTCSEQEQILYEDNHEKTMHDSPLFPCSAYLDSYSGNSCLWHWHDEIEAGYVREGVLTVYVNGMQHTLQKGDGVFINTSVLHAYAGADNRKTIFPNILFMPSLIYGSKESIFWTKYMQPLTNAVGLSHVIFSKDCPCQADAVESIAQAVQLSEQKTTGYEFKIRSHLSDLMLNICQNQSFQTKDQSRSRTEIERIRKMLSFIEANFMHQIQLQQIAASAYISSRECLRLFRNVLGTSPKQYVIQLRLQKAKHLLSDTAAPISDICARCGFQDQSYFTKIFRESFGISPAKYRKRR